MEKEFWETNLPNALYPLTDGETNIAFIHLALCFCNVKIAKKYKDQILNNISLHMHMLLKVAT